MPQLGLGLGLHRANRALFRGLLDQYAGAEAAYSLRALSSGWLAGDVVEVRRSVFGGGDAHDTFTASQITSGAMLAWVTEFSGTAAGFVSKWYDQSGNGNDAIQPATTLQPKIVSVGALILDDQGNATIKFDGINDFLDCGARIVELSANAATVFSVSQKDGGGTNQLGYICAEGDSVGPYSSNFILGNSIGNAVLWVNTVEFGTGGAGLRLESFLYNQTNFQAYVNGATSGAAGAATVNAETSNTIIGASGDGTTANTARKITALISYKSNQSANIAGIHSAINDLYTIY
jgi:hypothetical protein